LLQQSDSITASYRFRPTVFATVLTLVAAVVFAALSHWQYGRAGYKNSLAEAVALQSKQPPLALDKGTVDWPAQRFHPVTVNGTWEAQGTVLLDNVVHDGKAGYYVMTPLRLDNTAQRILVNRGWVEVGADRRVLPEVATPQGRVALAGTLDMPRSKPFFLFGDMAPDIEGNQRWLYLDLVHFTRKFGYPVAPYIILQTSASADSLRRDWPAYENNAGMHIGYSIQWAAFGLIALASYIALNTHKTSKESA
jgi:surfeit locus 1 family protein